jgi:riboflavin kinase/FMN adenylyltransferase
VTFDPHPRELLKLDEPFRYLTTIDERLKLLEGVGLDFAMVVEFTPQLILIAARDFVRTLVERLRMRMLIIGKGFALGHKRQGNEEFLRALGQELDYELSVAEPYRLEGEIVSSSTIRQLVREGRVERAAKYLGRFPSLSGAIESEPRQGPGYSTARVRVWPKRVLPAEGIYASLADWGAGPRGAATSIEMGRASGSGEPTVEVHILDFDGHLSGQELTLELIKHVRPVDPFESTEARMGRLQEDLRQVREVLMSTAQLASRLSGSKT